MTIAKQHLTIIPYRILYSIPVGKIAKKQSEGVRSALKNVVKNTLLQTAFSAILPTRFSRKISKRLREIFLFL